MILNGLPWKRTEIILSFLRLHPSTAFWTLVDYDVYYVSSKGFLPTVVYKTFFDITIISIPNELIDLNNSNIIKDHIRYLFYL